ncbi:MAG: SDR family NAD(P)-dependent oxidoreductase [Rectinemataceae bacterium]
MSDIDHRFIAPLLRGLFIGASGLPVTLDVREPSARRAGRLAPEFNVSVPGAYASPPTVDEAAAANVLRTEFAAWRARADAAGIPHDALPETAVVKDGAATVAYHPEIRCVHAVEAAPGSAANRGRVVEGRIALVTGGAQGFGEEIVRGLAASGAIVVIADLNLAGAAKLAAELEALYGPRIAFPVKVDVADPESVAAMFAVAARAAGGVDLVVSNAGVLKAGSVLEQDAASFKFVTDVNYVGFFNITKNAALLMRRQNRTAPDWKTDIVQINSKSGLQGSNKNAAYAGSKFGGIGLVQSFALELIEYGIKVNAICPGNFLDGPLWSDPEKGLFVQYLRSGKVPGAKNVADVRAFYEAKVPMQRGCEGPDVMRALYYLVEQEYETGQALPVTGGQVMLN